MQIIYEITKNCQHTRLISSNYASTKIYSSKINLIQFNYCNFFPHLFWISKISTLFSRTEHKLFLRHSVLITIVFQFVKSKWFNATTTCLLAIASHWKSFQTDIILSASGYVHFWYSQYSKYYMDERCVQVCYTILYFCGIFAKNFWQTFEYIHFSLIYLVPPLYLYLPRLLAHWTWRLFVVRICIKCFLK